PLRCAVDGHGEVPRGVRRTNGNVVVGCGPADDQCPRLHVNGRDRDRLQRGRAGAPVLVGGGDLHREGAGGRVDVTDLLTGRAGARLGAAVAPVDVEGERTSLVHRGRVGGAERESPHLAASPRGRAAYAGGRGHVVDRDV